MEGVGGGCAVARQAAAQRGADGVGQDGQDDVEVDVERDRAGEGVQAEGLDGFGEALFDGLITNGKFCCTHRVRLSLAWWRLPFRLRRQEVRTGAGMPYEDPDLECAPAGDLLPRWRAPVGSGLPAGAALGGRAIRRDLPGGTDHAGGA